MLRVAIQLGKWPHEITEQLSDEEIFEFDILDRIDLRSRYTKLDFYGSQISALQAAANTHRDQYNSDFVIPQETTLVPNGWLDLRPEADQAKIEQAICIAFGIKKTKKENDG